MFPRPNRGIGLETSILFAKEGANVLMADISAEAVHRAEAKVKQLVPSTSRVESIVRHVHLPLFCYNYHHLQKKTTHFFLQGPNPN